MFPVYTERQPYMLDFAFERYDHDLAVKQFIVRPSLSLTINFLGSIGVNTFVSSNEGFDPLNHKVKKSKLWKGLVCCIEPKCCAANIRLSHSIRKPRHSTRKPYRSRSSSPPFLPPQSLSPQNMK